MIQLAIRFFGVGPDRLVHTVAIANGLATPLSKIAVRSPPIYKLFPQGRLKASKTLVVSKRRVGNLKYASIAEVVYTDTFETGDTRFKYCQVFYDLVSRCGWVFPMHSKTEVGLAFATFCSQNWVPRPTHPSSRQCGGKQRRLFDERNSEPKCQERFYLPPSPAAELCRGLLWSHASRRWRLLGWFIPGPLSLCGSIPQKQQFLLITSRRATIYSRQGVWATAYEIVHNERFADSSIVVPFGCAALVLLTASERQKFRTRCALMIFLHYVDDHPLFTYAFYSPKTKRVVHRQDVIFWVSVFPMRSARTASGFHVEGDALVTYRSPPSVRGDVPDELSFHDWCTIDPLPDFSDEISGFELTPPAQLPDVSSAAKVDPYFPIQFPDHPSFGGVSTVPVPIRSMPDALPLPPTFVPAGPSSGDTPVSQDGFFVSNLGFTGDGQSQEFLSRDNASLVVSDLRIAKDFGSSHVVRRQKSLL
jgi:hypothetical protein